MTIDCDTEHSLINIKHAVIGEKKEERGWTGVLFSLLTTSACNSLRSTSSTDGSTDGNSPQYRTTIVRMFACEYKWTCIAFSVGIWQIPSFPSRTADMPRVFFSCTIIRRRSLLSLYQYRRPFSTLSANLRRFSVFTDGDSMREKFTNLYCAKISDVSCGIEISKFSKWTCRNFWKI